MLADVTTTIVTIPAPLVQFILTLLIPIITGLLTKYTLPSTVKGIITLALTTLTALIARAIQSDGEAVLSMGTVYNAVIDFAIAVAMYSGIYKKANLTSSTVDGALAPTAGIGPSITT